MKKRENLAWLMGFVLILSLTGCTTTNSNNTAPNTVYPGTTTKDTVVLNIVSEPVDLNPMRISDAVSQGVLAHCMAGLTRLDQQDKPVADLAESWEISDDLMTYTVHLRKDGKWSNGDAITMHDFYYSWITQMTPDTGSLYASYLYDNIKNGEAFYKGEVDASKVGLTVVDDDTMIIEWSQPMPEAKGLFNFTQPFYLPINQKAYEEIGDQHYAKEADKMVTSGAYTITEWVHDDHITMEKSQTYLDADQIQIEKVKLVMIGDANTSLNAFVAGEIDMSNLYNEQISQVKEKSESAVNTFVDGGTWYLSFNVLDENLSNVKLRKALASAVDTQSLLDYVINDGSIVASGLVPDVIRGVGGTSYAQARGTLFQYNLQAANEYLDQALQELGKTKEQVSLSFYCSDSTYSQNQAIYLQQQWKENLGLNVQLKTLPSNALLEAQYNGEVSFLVDGWGPTENDPMTFLENYATGNLNNSTQYSNAEYDQLLEASKLEKDPATRQDILIEAEKILIRDMVIGPMYYTCTTYATSKKLSGLIRTSFQNFSLRYATITTN